MAAGHRCCRGLLQKLGRTVSPHPGKKAEGISATATSRAGPGSNFPPGAGRPTAPSDPAEAARTRAPTSPARRRRPITARLRRERLEGASSRRATAPTANGEPRWESSLTPLTNGKGVALAEVPDPVAAGSGVAAGSRTLGLKGILETSLLALPVPPADPQTTARSSPAGSGACPAGKEVHRSRRWRHLPLPPML